MVDIPQNLMRAVGINAQALITEWHYCQTDGHTSVFQMEDNPR